jgi:hypothetical protein
MAAQRLVELLFWVRKKKEPISSLAQEKKLKDNEEKAWE